MKIVYCSSLVSEKYYDQCLAKNPKIPGQAAQKYYKLVLNGLLSLKDIDILSISALPINRNISKKLFIFKKSESLNNVRYTYLPTINLFIIKNITLFITSFIRSSLFFLKHREDTILIGDILSISISSGALLAARLFRIQSIGIVTDLPYFMNRKKNSITLKLNNYLFNLFDKYVFLTEQMNEFINKNSKPYVVIEGLVDIDMAKVDNILEKKHRKKVCIYAGGIQKIYGIKNLIQAFIKIDLENTELHIYGDGDFKEELIKIAENHDKVKYFGVMPNDYIVHEELKATLLINPRPTDEEYTKYSFPSKNMEYMVSGTPTLTTKLPGMPEEYSDYVYLIEDETIDGLSKTLTEILSLPKEKLHEKGLRAKKWIIKEKNNIVQAEKVIYMIKERLL